MIGRTLSQVYSSVHFSMRGLSILPSALTQLDMGAQMT